MDIRNEIIEQMKEELDLKDIVLEATLIDLGLDSIDVATYLLQAEQTYGIEFSQDDMKEQRTIGDIINLIEKKVNSK